MQDAHTSSSSSKSAQPRSPSFSPSLQESLFLCQMWNPLLFFLNLLAPWLASNPPTNWWPTQPTLGRKIWWKCEDPTPQIQWKSLTQNDKFPQDWKESNKGHFVLGAGLRAGSNSQNLNQSDRSILSNRPQVLYTWGRPEHSYPMWRPRWYNFGAKPSGPRWDFETSFSSSRTPI